MCTGVVPKIFLQFLTISLAIIVASCASGSTQPTENPTTADVSDTVESDTGTTPSTSSEPSTTGSSAVENDLSVPSTGPETSASNDLDADVPETVTTVAVPESEAEMGRPSTSTIPTTTSPPNSTVPSDVYTEEPSDPYITYEPQT